MNIFVLNSDPVLAAKDQCNKHVIKMVLETAQLLCTAVVMTGGTAPYRATHKNHPCAIWARQSKENFNWLRRHGLALAAEYTYRYGKVHKSAGVIEDLSDKTIPDGPLTPFALAMPDECKVSGDPVASYRNYYRTDKAKIAEWYATEKCTPYTDPETGERTNCIRVELPKPDWWENC